MDAKRRQPLGIELVKRGIVTEEDIEREYEISQDAGDDYIGGLS